MLIFIKVDFKNGESGKDPMVQSAAFMRIGTTHANETGQSDKSRRFAESALDPDTDEEAFRCLERRYHDKGDLAQLKKLKSSSRYVSFSGALVGWDEEGNTTWNGMQSHAPCHDDHYRLRIGNQDIVAKFLKVQAACDDDPSLAVAYLEVYKQAMLSGQRPPTVDAWLKSRVS